MGFPEMKAIIEGLLFVAGDEGLTAKQVAELLDYDLTAVVDLLDDMKHHYRREHRGLQVIEIAGAYRLTTLPEHAVYFEKLAYSPSHSTLSQAALETLAIVAYKQPVTKAEIEEIRGVKCDKSIQTLVSKGLIYEVARAEAIGRPILYGTTKLFLDYFGLGDLKELPEPNIELDESNLEEETRLLFETLSKETKQLTIDDISDE